MARATNKETGAPYSDLEVVVQAYSFVLAAYETTTASIAFAVYFLATHPEKERILLEEIDAFGRDRQPTFADVTDGKTFAYVDAVFKETLRLYPAVPLAIREAEKDLQLGQYAVPAGTQMAVCVYSMQRHPAHWADPDSFIPERFLSHHPAAEGNNMDAYMPFGDGPRGCIGQKYAWQEAMVALIKLYQKFTFRLTEQQLRLGPLDVRMSLSLTPRNGVSVTAHFR